MILLEKAIRLSWIEWIKACVSRERQALETGIRMPFKPHAPRKQLESRNRADHCMDPPLSGFRRWSVLLILIALLTGTFSTVRADQCNCSDPPYNGVIDGDIYPSVPDNVKIDTDCTIKNYPGGDEHQFQLRQQ